MRLSCLERLEMSKHEHHEAEDGHVTPESLSSTAHLTANIQGHSNVLTVNVRIGPSVNDAIKFRGRVGLTGIPILAVQLDEDHMSHQGNIYRWYKLLFPDGQDGWVREDFIKIIARKVNW